MLMQSKARLSFHRQASAPTTQSRDQLLKIIYLESRNFVNILWSCGELCASEYRESSMAASRSMDILCVSGVFEAGFFVSSSGVKPFGACILYCNLRPSGDSRGCLTLLRSTTLSQFYGVNSIKSILSCSTWSALTI